MCMFKPFCCKGILECCNNHACFALLKNKPGEQRRLQSFLVKRCWMMITGSSKNVQSAEFRSAKAHNLSVAEYVGTFPFPLILQIEVPVYVSEPGFFAVVGEMKK